MRAWILLVPLLTLPLAGCTVGAGLTVSSPTVQPGEPIPPQHTCDQNDRSPPLDVGSIPAEAKTLAIAMTDRTGEAPSVGWVVWNIQAGPGSVQVPEDRVPAGASVGTNSKGEQAYAGPCPPSGSEHTYRFTAYAVDRTLSLEDEATLEELKHRLEDRVLARGHLSAPSSR